MFQNTAAILLVTVFANVLCGKDQNIRDPRFCTRHVLRQSRPGIEIMQYVFKTQYMIPGQRQVYFPLPCVDPPTPTYTEVVVCDWIAPPHIEVTLAGTHLYIVRNDPTERYAQNAEIDMKQICTHTNTTQTFNALLSENLRKSLPKSEVHYV